MGLLLSIIGILVVIIIGILSWPRIQDKLWGKHSDTYVCVYGMEHSYTINQLKAQAPIRSKFTIHPIRFPEGVSSVQGDEIPLKFFNWTYSDNEKLYTVTAHNKGDGVARRTKVAISFAPNLIRFVKIRNEGRVKIVQGGKPTGTRVTFEIAELLPGEMQDFEILVDGKNIKSFDVWSESEGAVKNVFIFDIIIEPDKDFLG